jgi:hypothetical protein
MKRLESMEIGVKLEEASGSKWRKPPEKTIAEAPSGLSSNLPISAIPESP